MIGKTVQMKPVIAKWHLDHPEIYGYTAGVDDSYETETLIHLMCAFEIPVTGKVIRKGHDCWYVKWKIAGLSTSYHIDRRHFTVIP